jgi:hypothetical protein
MTYHFKATRSGWKVKGLGRIATLGRVLAVILVPWRSALRVMGRLIVGPWVKPMSENPSLDNAATTGPRESFE